MYYLLFTLPATSIITAIVRVIKYPLDLLLRMNFMTYISVTWVKKLSITDQGKNTDVTR